MVFLPSAPVRIQPYFGYRTRDRLLITARALRAKADDFSKGTRWRAMRTMMAQFASHEVAGLAVELELRRPGGGSTRHAGVTDGEGFAQFDVALDPPWPLGPEPVWESVLLHWTNREGAHCVEGQVLAPGADTALAVISDIDDTIVETGITGNFRAVLRNWRRVLLELPHDRILVPSADVFYSALGGGLFTETAEGEAGKRRPATSRPFFYVSSSPWNLFAYLVTYLGARGLPLGPILLRDWGLDRATFGHASHGAHKRAAIDGLLALYPEMQFALIGDDSQGDLTAYADTARHHPGRVRAIFIRKLGEPMTGEEEAGKAAIEAAGVPLWIGESWATGRDFLAAIGLLGDHEAEAIVKAVETPAAPVPAAPASPPGAAA